MMMGQKLLERERERSLYVCRVDVLECIYILTKNINRLCVNTRACQLK